MVCTEQSGERLDRYRDYRKYKDVEEDYNGSDCTFMVVNLQLNTKSSGQLPLPRLTLKRVRSTEVEEERIDEVREEIKAEVKEELVKAEPPLEERTYVVPLKKRRYVEPPEETTSVKNISTVEAEKQVLKQSSPIKRTHKSKAMSSDESEKEQQQKKQKQKQPKAASPKAASPKAASPQPSAEASSSKKTHGPCEDEACAGPSTSGFSASTNPISEHGVWMDTLRTNFDQLETSKILRKANLTKAQNEILERSLTQLCKKMACVKMNSDRFLKMHKCLGCEWTISHQCLSFEFLRKVPMSTQLMRQVNIVPNRTVICNCGFAFFHAHLKRPRAASVVENTVSIHTAHLREIDRVTNVRCNKCHIKVTMADRGSNVCRGLAKWDSMNGDNRQDFYDTIQSCLHYPEPGAPSLDEFFACPKNCCLFFHRCTNKPKVPDAQGTSPG